MKIRQGFVSNSSSSSFICEISGRVESGMDLCLSDIEMTECENGHLFDDNYIIGQAPRDDSDAYHDWRYECPPANCPICSMNKIPDTLLLKYIIKSRDLKKSDIIRDIKASFNKFEQFKEFIS